MFIEETEFESRYNSKDNLIHCLPTTSDASVNPSLVDNNLSGSEPEPTAIVKPLYNGGRNKGNNNIPSFLKPIIGTSAHLQKSKEVAQAFGISKSQVDQFKEGNRYFDHPDSDIKRQIESNLNLVESSAISLTLKALGILGTKLEDEDELEKLRPTEISSLAKDMSSVAEKARPREINNQQNVQLIVYAPSQKTSESYDVIEVEAT
jgi:transcriptional regulator with XRE-family HTH domain